MNPLLNAFLGVLFLGVGAVATIVMYYLRGAQLPTARMAEPALGDTSPAPEEEYLGPWRRRGDEREGQMDDIHAIAETGRSITEAMRTGKRTVGWDDLLIKGAQLARLPLNEDEPVATETVIGPAADRPLVIDTPIYVSHMSFGALSREIKIALARGSAAVGTAICSGEGGILDEELAAAHRFLFEYVPNQYSVTDDYLGRVDAIEIKIGQSAKPGMGGHLPGGKVTGEIAQVRGRPEGQDIISPSRFGDIRTPDDLKRKVDWLRESSGGRPVGVKLAAGNIEADLKVALVAEPDFVTLDGRAGATGAAPKVVKDSTSVPTLLAIRRARKVLDQYGKREVSLVVTGGLRVSSDMAKALALGADAVALATAALMAAGCQQYRICNTGRCPVGITSQDPKLRGRLNVDRSAERLANYLRVCTAELKTFARLTGHDAVRGLSVGDLCTTNGAIAERTGVERA